MVGLCLTEESMFSSLPKMVSTIQPPGIISSDRDLKNAVKSFSNWFKYVLWTQEGLSLPGKCSLCSVEFSAPGRASTIYAMFEQKMHCTKLTLAFISMSKNQWIPDFPVRKKCRVVGWALNTLNGMDLAKVQLEHLLVRNWTYMWCHCCMY